jgi:uroporphyrinogen decarboxylase
MVRKKAGSFLNLCFNPELASEVTLQPIKRFGFDAAIIFSDILVIPYALGSDLDYVEGEGPQLSTTRNKADLNLLKKGRVREKLTPVAEALKLTKENLPKETTLIGFAGAPWTVATYMVEGEGNREFTASKKFLEQDKQSFLALIDVIIDETIDYLCMQVEAGAEVLQLFDSWASAVPAENFEELVLNPATRIIKGVREKHPNIPFIGFPKDIGKRNIDYISTGVNALCIGQEEDRIWVKENLQTKVAVQGNLNPEILADGSKQQIIDETLKIIDDFKNGPHIFNLGHGILKHTPVENVELLIETVRGK